MRSQTILTLPTAWPLFKRSSVAAFERSVTLTITAVTVFERLRGYRAAIRAGKPFERQLQAFEALVANCVVLPFDQEAAAVAADIWSASSRSGRRQLGDILIASVAVSRKIPLATRNRRDFQHLTRASGVNLRLVDWTIARPVVAGGNRGEDGA